MGAAGPLVDQVFAALGPGVRGLVYDYSPQPFSPDPARFVLPAVIEARGSAEQLVAGLVWPGALPDRSGAGAGRADAATLRLELSRRRAVAHRRRP